MMRCGLLSLLGLMGSLCVATGGVAAEPLRLRVLSYNIHHAEGVDQKLDLPRIAQVIRGAQPDLVALQEVDRTVRRTQGVDQPAELARLTEMQVAFGGNIELQGGQYGNAILSRFPVVEPQNHPLPNMDAGEQRGVLEVQLQLPAPHPALRLFATHLDHRSDERERLASAQAINERAVQHPLQPALLAGDLNANPASATLKQFGLHWTPTSDKPLATIPVDRPTEQIDFVLYRPMNRWKVTEVRVLEEPTASDHRPILAVLELLPTE